jgi:hypothetical protein
MKTAKGAMRATAERLGKGMVTKRETVARILDGAQRVAITR